MIWPNIEYHTKLKLSGIYNPNKISRPDHIFKDKEVQSIQRQYIFSPCRIHFVVHKWFFVFLICSLSFWLMTTFDNCFYLGSQQAVIKLIWWPTKGWNCIISKENEVGFLSVRFPYVHCIACTWYSSQQWQLFQV